MPLAQFAAGLAPPQPAQRGRAHTQRQPLQHEAFVLPHPPLQQPQQHERDPAPLQPAHPQGPALAPPALQQAAVPAQMQLDAPPALRQQQAPQAGADAAMPAHAQVALPQHQEQPRQVGDALGAAQRHAPPWLKAWLHELGAHSPSCAIVPCASIARLRRWSVLMATLCEAPIDMGKAARAQLASAWSAEDDRAAQRAVPVLAEGMQKLLMCAVQGQLLRVCKVFTELFEDLLKVRCCMLMWAQIAPGELDGACNTLSRSPWRTLWDAESRAHCRRRSVALCRSSPRPMRMQGHRASSPATCWHRPAARCRRRVAHQKCGRKKSPCTAQAYSARWPRSSKARWEAL